MSFFSGADGEGAAEGVSNLLTNQLVKDGTFSVIERSKIESILTEQNLGASDRIEPATAAKLGRILGVDAVLIGTIAKFDVENKSKGLSIGGLFGSGGRKQIATVQLVVRLVSSTTAEILKVAEATGTATQKDKSLSVSGVGTSSDSDSRGRILGAADISDNQVVLNKGSQAGLRSGMVLSVERIVKTIKDPSTGKVLRVNTQPIGKLELTEVDSQSSVAKILTGKGGFRVGDEAKIAK